MDEDNRSPWRPLDVEERRAYALHLLNTVTAALVLELISHLL